MLLVSAWLEGAAGPKTKPQRLKPKRILKHLILINPFIFLKHKRTEFSHSSFSRVTERQRESDLATATPWVTSRLRQLSPVPNSSQQLNALSPCVHCTGCGCSSRERCTPSSGHWPCVSTTLSPFAWTGWKTPSQVSRKSWKLTFFPSCTENADSNVAERPGIMLNWFFFYIWL